MIKSKANTYEYKCSGNLELLNGRLYYGIEVCDLLGALKPYREDERFASQIANAFLHGDTEGILHDYLLSKDSDLHEKVNDAWKKYLNTMTIGENVFAAIGSPKLTFDYARFARKQVFTESMDFLLDDDAHYYHAGEAQVLPNYFDPLLKLAITSGALFDIAIPTYRYSLNYSDVPQLSQFNTEVEYDWITLASEQSPERYTPLFLMGEVERIDNEHFQVAWRNSHLLGQKDSVSKFDSLDQALARCCELFPQTINELSTTDVQASNQFSKIERHRASVLSRFELARTLINLR